MFKYCIFLFSCHSLFAITTLQVISPFDNDPGGFGNSGDLRHCLNTINTNLNSSPDEYVITFASPMYIQLNGILPLINNSLYPVNITIGNSDITSLVTIDGGATYPGFFIPTGSVTLQNLIFQNCVAKGGNGGDGISGGGGGMGAGSAIYAPRSFGSAQNPLITLKNVSINNCSAIGGNGGNYIGGSSTGNEGGGGGGGLYGDGGSVTAIGDAGGGGGGGFGGNGGNVNFSTGDPQGGGGGGGGGFGSRTSVMSAGNLGNGGSDQEEGQPGNAYGPVVIAGSGGGDALGGSNSGGGGGGGDPTLGGGVFGGGGGGSSGTPGRQALGTTPPGGATSPSGGNGGDGGGGGGGGIVTTSFTTNGTDGQAGSGGYAGGGGGGAGRGSYDTNPPSPFTYTVRGGDGGVAGGGGGGGVNESGSTDAKGGDSLGGGGGGGGGPINGDAGSDLGNLGGGAGGSGSGSSGSGSGGGGGGGGSALGGAIFLDTETNLIIEALSGIPTRFNTTNNTVQAGNFGSAGSGGGNDGFSGLALGNNIFLRELSILTFSAQDADDLLILDEGVSFIDDADLIGESRTNVEVRGNGTVVYNGTTDYQGLITINNANFNLHGLIDRARVSVCRDVSISSQRGTLSGTGTLTGAVNANSGAISPDPGGTLTLGSLRLNPASPFGSLGSLTHITIDSSGTSLVSVTGAAELAGILEIDLASDAMPGAYTVLTSSGITGEFTSTEFTRAIPASYSVSYLPIGSPTFVQFDFLGFEPPSPSSSTLSTLSLRGNNLRVANYLNSLYPDANSLGLTEQYALLNSLSSPQYQKALESISPSRNSTSTFTAQNIMFMFSESLNSHFTKKRIGQKHNKSRYTKETALVADSEFLAEGQSPHKTMYAPKKNTNSQIWVMGFGQFSHQNAQKQNPSFNFDGGGLSIAYDYGNTDQGYIGALAGYAYSSIKQKQSMGDSHINAGYLSLYGARSFSDFFIDAAILGDFMGVSQKRNIFYPGFHETAKSSYFAGQLDLHVGIGYDINVDTAAIEPFGLLDIVFEWDPSYVETGAAPYNMAIPSRSSWMLRFETGFNGYNTLTYDWGIFILSGKISYVYKDPHNVGNINAAIINAPTSFGVEAFTSHQSLISPALELFWQTNWNGFGSLSYNGEFGNGYSSNQFYGKIGYSF